MNKRTEAVAKMAEGLNPAEAGALLVHLVETAPKPEPLHVAMARDLARVSGLDDGITYFCICGSEGPRDSRCGPCNDVRIVPF